MAKSIRIYLCLMIGVLFLFAAGAAPALAANSPAAKPPLNLTAKEKAWLAQHKTIRVAFDGYFPPHSFVNDDGKIEGLSVDVLQLLAKRIGVTIETSPKTVWKELFEAAKLHEVDVVATMGRQPEREQWFAFTQPYIFKSLVIMTMEGTTTISKSEDLAGKRVALVEKYQYVKPLLKRYPTMKPYYVDTMLDGLNAVAVGKADAVITFLGAGHYLQTKYQIAGLKFAAVFNRDQFNESIAVRKDWPELASILDKALDSIDSQEMLTLQQRWLPSEALTERAVLTTEERTWLRAHPVIRIGIDSEFVPFEMLDKNGSYVGIAADYLHLLSARLGINFELVPGLSWSQVMGKARSREIDLLPCIGRTSEREQYLNYSNPYTKSQRVIITRDDAPFISSLADISTWKVAAQADTSNEGYLKEHTTIKPVRVATTQEGLVALSGGKVAAFVCNIGSAAYWIRELKVTNLKIAAPISEGLLHVAVRKDWPQLVEIINKGLATVTEEDKNQINQRWIAVDYKPGIDRQTVFKYVAFTIGFILLGFTGFTLWNRTLRKQVKLKALALQQEFAERKKAEEALVKSESRFQAIVENVQLLAVLLDVNGKVTFCNQYLLNITNYTQEELIGSDWFDLMIPKANTEVKELFLQGLKRGEIDAHFENPIIGKGGKLRFITWDNTTLRDASDVVIGTASIGSDITERKQIELELKKHREHLEELVKERTITLGGKTNQLERSQTAMQYLLEDVNEANKKLEEANEKLQEVDRLKSMFIASMSHELRTPLNSVIGFSSILINEWVGPVNDEQKKNLTSILRSGKHLLSLINDVIDVSKIEAGMIEVNVEDFALSELLTEVEQTFTKEAQDRKLSLSIEQIDLPMSTDRRRLLQCLFNLVSNGLKFTEKGTVTLTVSHDADSGEVTFAVSDTGIGIGAEEQEKLFQPFSRIQSHLSATVLGTGLGLYLTRRIVGGILHGNITVTSAAGSGSSFTITIPVRIDAEQ